MLLVLSLVFGCGGSKDDDRTDIPPGEPIAPPPPSCASELDGGVAPTAEPELIASLGDRWHEAWLGSPAVADIDEDGELEILVPRDSLMLGWHMDGEIVFRTETGGRIWSSPVVADILPSEPGLEIAAASRSDIYLWTATGEDAPGRAPLPRGR
jgi:hypothetical protein